MSEKKEVQELERTDVVHQASSFWEKFQKPIITAAVALVVIVGAWFAYNKFYKEPAEERAADAIFKAEEYFRNDSLRLALNGDGQNKGFLYVISNFGGTKAGELAHYYAGVSYLKLGDFKKAVEHLEDFSTDAKQVQMLAYGCLADAYSELGKKEDAVKFYEKAGRYFEEDEFNASEYLFRAGYLLESMGKNSEAVSVYKELKEKFPKTEKGFSADKFIYRLSVEKNEFTSK